MIEYNLDRPTSSTTFAFVIGAAIAAAPPIYPPRNQPYEIHLPRETYSESSNSIKASSQPIDNFEQQVTSIFNSFAQSQIPLDAELRRAIFSDISALYEG